MECDCGISWSYSLFNNHVYGLPFIISPFELGFKTFKDDNSNPFPASLDFYLMLLSCQCS